MDTPNDTGGRSDETDGRSRRRVLAAAGTALGAAVAGCVGGREVSGGASPNELSPDTVHRTRFTRVERDETYRLRYRWDRAGERYETAVDVLKRRYREAASADRGIGEVFGAAKTDATAAALSRSLAAGLTGAGVDDPNERLRAAVEFVRSMPYVTDIESTGSPEYPRHVPETLVEHEGDCEDYAAVLGGVLAADPFGLDPALIVLPGHAAVGVDPAAFEEVEGGEGDGAPDPTVRAGGHEYVYLDTTYEIELGTLPTEQHGDEVVAVYDDDWLVGDPVAALSQLRDADGSDDPQTSAGDGTGE